MNWGGDTRQSISESSGQISGLAYYVDKGCMRHEDARPMVHGGLRAVAASTGVGCDEGERNNDMEIGPWELSRCMQSTPVS
jgi:hypothetical protein